MNKNQRPFENDHFLQSELASIIKAAGVFCVVETGTEYGGSSNAFLNMPPVKCVITMDIQRKFGQGDLDSNVIFLLGDSRERLKDAIPIANAIADATVLFFLDAHTSIISDPCPIAGELEVIRDFYDKSLERLKPIIVIHDCLVPDGDFGFDTYADGPICFENLKAGVEAIYPKGYVKRFNTVASGSKRGCLFIQPA